MMVSRMFRRIRQTFGVITSTFTILSQAHPTRGEKRDIPPKWWLDGDEEVVFFEHYFFVPPINKPPTPTPPLSPPATATPWSLR